MTWKWIAAAGIVAVFALGFLWIGAAHRDRCMAANLQGCSLLPLSGHGVAGSASVAKPWWAP